MRDRESERQSKPTARVSRPLNKLRPERGQQLKGASRVAFRAQQSQDISMALSFAAMPVTAFHGVASTTKMGVQMKAPTELVTLAKELNPVVGYWNPLGLGEMRFTDGDAVDGPVKTQAAAVGFLRHVSF